MDNIYLNLTLEIFRAIVLVIFCHFVGDYLFQTEYMARDKDKDWWVLIAHCVCYCVPFLLCFGIRWQLGFIFIAHLIIDWGKCRKHWYGIFYDQYFHIVSAMVYVLPVFTEGTWRGFSI